MSSPLVLEPAPWLRVGGGARLRMAIRSHSSFAGVSNAQPESPEMSRSVLIIAEAISSLLSRTVNDDSRTFHAQASRGASIWSLEPPPAASVAHRPQSTAPQSAQDGSRAAKRATGRSRILDLAEHSATLSWPMGPTGHPHIACMDGHRITCAVTLAVLSEMSRSVLIIAEAISS